MSEFVSPFVKVINLYLHEPYASLLNGIIFGVKLNNYKDFYLDLKRVGLLHIVVLSGMNLTLLSALVSRFTLVFGRKVSSLISVIIIVLFIFFVGVQAPLLRAGFMAILTHVAIIYGYKAYSLYFLFLSGLLSLIVKPEWLFSISFQLSYLATFGLILFSKGYKREKGTWRKFLRFVKMELRTSLSAQVFTAPLIFFYFKEISLISPVSNILVAPFIAPLMVFGMASAFLGKLNYYLGLPFAYLSFGILRYFVFVIEVLSKIPYSFISL